jgi:hypothetical protein
MISKSGGRLSVNDFPDFSVIFCGTSRGWAMTTAVTNAMTHAADTALR